MTDYRPMIENLVPAVRTAGTAIMNIYERDPVAEEKADGSPVTEADRAANAILITALKQTAPDIPIVSEEDADSHSLSGIGRFFLVDPLDGTKEFLKRDGKGSFTVNIGLVEDSVPVMGIVYAPALDRMFTGCLGVGSLEGQNALKVRPVPEDGAVAVASASHRDPETDHWLAENGIKKIVSIGSSLKFCLVAAGEADVYPRFGPTMEWDTAAGDAVLRAAGGTVITPDGNAFSYGKPEYRNGAFVAKGKM